MVNTMVNMGQIIDLAARCAVCDVFCCLEATKLTRLTFTVFTSALE